MRGYPPNISPETARKIARDYTVFLVFAVLWPIFVLILILVFGWR